MMRGTYFLGADVTPKFEVREMEFRPLGKHDVLVKNMACGICGTDVHIYHGEKKDHAEKNKAFAAENTAKIRKGANI